MKKLITMLISLMLILLPLNAQEHQKRATPQEIYEKYPGAEISVISWDEYESIKHRYKDTELVYLAENENFDSNSSNVRTGASARMHVPDININNDNAAVIFVIIGVVIVAALVVYAGDYLYEVTMTDKKHTYWVDNAFAFSTFYNDNSHNGGSMAGYRISSGFDNKNIKVGVSAEIGNFDFNFRDADPEDWVGSKGNYFMAGPTVRLYSPDKSIYVFVEMLGGKSDSKEINAIGHARAGFGKIFPNNFTFGGSYGALFVGLGDTEGILQNSSQFETTTCLEAGYRF